MKKDSQLSENYENQFLPYVTGFGKTCIIHTSDFAHLEIHKHHRELYLDVKLSGMNKE